MQFRSLSIAATLLASAATFTTSVRAADRAALHQEAVVAAHSMSYGEVGPEPARTTPVSAAERMEARTRRTADGAQAARAARIFGDVYSIPAVTATPRSEQPPATLTAADRRAEVRRANLAGELSSPGEGSF